MTTYCILILRDIFPLFVNLGWSLQSIGNLQVLGPRLAMEEVDWQYEIFAGPAGLAIFCKNIIGYYYKDTVINLWIIYIYHFVRIYVCECVCVCWERFVKISSSVSDIYYNTCHTVHTLSCCVVVWHWMIQWNLSVTTTSIIKFITCDLFSNVF